MLESTFAYFLPACWFGQSSIHFPYCFCYFSKIEVPSMGEEGSMFGDY